MLTDSQTGQCQASGTEVLHTHKPRHLHHHIYTCPHPGEKPAALTSSITRHRKVRAILHSRAPGHRHSDVKDHCGLQQHWSSRYIRRRWSQSPNSYHRRIQLSCGFLWRFWISLYSIFKHGVKCKFWSLRTVIMIFLRQKRYATEAPSLRTAAGEKGFIPFYPFIAHK